MNDEEALAIVERALCEERLSQLQVTVFRHAWEEQSYQAIAKSSGYEVGYIKQTGSQLWQLLSKAFGEKVTKSNVHSALRNRFSMSSIVSSGAVFAMRRRFRNC